MKLKFAHLLLFLSTLFYAGNYTIAKYIMPDYITAYPLVMLRVIAGAVFFIALSPFIKKEKIDRKDYLRFVLCALFGTSLNQLTFFQGIELSNPISGAVIMTLIPIIVYMISVFFFGKPFVIRKGIGIVIGFIGALILILYNNSSGEVLSGSLIGNGFILLNAILYSFYIVLAKRLLEKYHPYNVAKWLYIIGVFIVFPFAYDGIAKIEWAEIPSFAYWALAYVLIFVTCLTYLFNLTALTIVQATTMSAYVYLQPVLATIIALILQVDEINEVKIFSMLLIFAGVFMVSYRSKKKSIN